MQRKNFEAVAEAIRLMHVKTTAAIKDLLGETDSKHENAALAGKRLTARARVSALFDKDTFVETGALIKRRATEFDAEAVESDDFEGVITGYGSVGGSLVFVFAEDYSRSKGAMSEAHAKKITAVYDMAVKNGAPVVGIFDSAGAFVLDGVSALAGYGHVMAAASAASGVIPQIAIIAGVCAGGSAVAAAMADVTIVSKADGKMYVKAGCDSHESVSIETEDEISAIEKAKELLAVLPSNNCEGTVRIDGDANGISDVTMLGSEGYDVRDVISAISDGGRVIELYASYAPEVVTSISFVGGVAVGVVATNPAHESGELTSGGAKKAAKMISFCDSFGIPVLTLVDGKGISNESSPTPSDLARLAYAYTTAACPKVTVVTGEAYGTQYTLMGSKSVGADIVYALPSAKISSMKADAAVALLWDDKFAGTSDPAAKRAELEAEWDANFGSATEAALHGEIDDIIEGGELRARVASALEMLSMKNADAPGRRHVNLPM